ncbi:hypothetical protein PHYSODRAFT_296509 [Phytophthora sojae]|uniref:Uncharacterized protein n=1 Tax=Phytophthora sojae (strain P6497) TaxID=1094619 RepID=G4YW32_PHYSP|nr:hypothetical protein PHYSODRAFT_296509 [Phytophthora sojae]EGZ24415.1 hypothetical protein PHYSODRAFT_296509 [Phytophthora sojae]|eukprot:XP_009519703.1 hypothetical protein PHYSODRAFT_296509 [Phytophthora sojae]
MPHDYADAVQAPGVAPVPVPGQVADQVGDDAAGNQFDVSTRESGRGASDSSGDRLDRLEGLIESLVRDASRDRLEKAQLQHGVYVSNSSAAGSSAFSQFLAARRQRVRADSLTEAMRQCSSNSSRLLSRSQCCSSSMHSRRTRVCSSSSLRLREASG